jgi:hypothetical protein
LSDNIGRVVARDGPASLPTAAVGKARRQRRPTGEPPPLPTRSPSPRRRGWSLAAIALADAFAAAQHTSWLRPAVPGLLRNADLLRTVPARPHGVPVITGWTGYEGGSPPMAVLTFCLLGAVYCLAVPRSRPLPAPRQL